jgi:hypothetical protein
MISLGVPLRRNGFLILVYALPLHEMKYGEADMLRWLSFLIGLCLAPGIRAQEETWLKARNPENASYFTPKMRVTGTEASPALWPGAGLGWIVGSVVSVGFEGYWLASNIRPDEPGSEYFDMALGGMMFQAIPFPERRTHLAFNLLIGGGGSQTGGEFGIDSLSNHGFFFIEPGASLELNLTQDIRLAPGVSYMWVPGSIWGMKDKTGLTEMAFSLGLIFKKTDSE